MRASSRCRSGASGVVRSNGTGRPSMRTPVVPTTPGGRPAARKIASRTYVVVVLPFVPVTPMSGTRSDGCPKKTAETGPIARRTDGTMTCAHETGTVRALLCVRCNNALGQFKEDPELVRSAAAYLDRHDPEAAAQIARAKERAYALKA